MDSQDTQKQEWHKPEMVSLAGSASAGGRASNPTEADKGNSNNENSEQANPGPS